MLLVRQVARPEGALLCAVELLPNGATSASAKRQPLPHRLPLRSIPPQRFACGSSHSRGTWSSTVCAEEFPTPLEASFAILQLLPWPGGSLIRPRCARLLAKPEYFPAE